MPETTNFIGSVIMDQEQVFLTFDPTIRPRDAFDGLAKLSKRMQDPLFLAGAVVSHAEQRESLQKIEMAAERERLEARAKDIEDEYRNRQEQTAVEAVALPVEVEIS